MVGAWDTKTKKLTVQHSDTQVGKWSVSWVQHDTWWGQWAKWEQWMLGIREGCLPQVRPHMVLKEKHEVTRQWEAADRGTEFQGGKHVSVRWSHPSLAHGD